jgi:hypothetical protein
MVVRTRLGGSSGMVIGMESGNMGIASFSLDMSLINSLLSANDYGEIIPYKMKIVYAKKLAYLSLRLFWLQLLVESEEA